MREEDIRDPEGRTLSVIVPVYNERNTVAEVLRRLRRVELPVDLEVIVVDDGSTDGTSQILSALEDSTVQVVWHAANRGKGAAIRTALEHARGELVLIQDADLEYDPEDWPRLLRPVLRNRAQVVYGSRFSGEGGSMPASDWVGHRFLSLATNLLYNTSLSDMECGYKLFTRKVLDDITIESDRFDFEPEITAKVLRRGYQIYEVPISYSGRPASEGRKFDWRDGVRALGTLVRYRWGRPR
ncbi:MAG: glycosyltransferase family 2 protein [Actinomycetota bacterium]|nr:glycosyltransferase family 2 protein [Actinomycetota bacterium]